jgi:predicted membrane channel-forming protein YqfA (hemolysin III family)
VAGTWRIWLLVATAAAVAAKLWSMPRIPQDPAYHRFADTRTILGVVNGLNVLSNLAFALVGLAGLRPLLSARVAMRERAELWPWLVFFAGVVLTSVGSTAYHLIPSNESLVWDRLPMAVGFMGLLAALIAERIALRTGLWLLGPLIILGVASVLYWHFTERAGVGDLRPYYFVQFYPLAAIPLVLLLFPPVYTGSPAYLLALAAYLLAKLAEVKDGPVFQFSGIVSGHTLKHLLAAAGIGALAWMLGRRKVLERPFRA